MARQPFGRVSACGFVAVAVVSVAFGVEARQNAYELEQQAIQLREITRLAKENEKLAKENEKKIGQVLVSGLLIPIGRNPHQLTSPLDVIEAERPTGAQGDSS